MQDLLNKDLRKTMSERMSGWIPTTDYSKFHKIRLKEQVNCLSQTRKIEKIRMKNVHVF